MNFSTWPTIRLIGTIWCYESKLGRKERLVPISTEMRRGFYTYISRHLGPPTYLFSTRTGNRVTVRNFQRDMEVYGKHLHITDVRFSPHTLRHTFACSYLKAGGNLEYLRRILGHSSLLITQRYLQSLGVDDLADVHNDFSPIPPTRGGKGYDDAAMGRGLTNVETTVAVATGDVRWVLTRRSDEDSTTLGVCGTGSRVGGWDGLRP